MTTLDAFGEHELIKRFAPLLPGRPDVALGPGDDAAVVQVEGGEYDYLLTSDPLIEGIHFDPGAEPLLVGHKAIGRTISDVAAMGGEPMWSLVDIAAPPAFSAERLETVVKGMALRADQYGMAMVGGDTSSAPQFQLHVFTVGRLPRGTAITRAGARRGDHVYVTGTLGGSRAGKHLEFEPRLAEGMWLREAGWAHAMIDVTDGLATDLRHLMAASGVGVEIEIAQVPLSDAARAMAGDDRSALEHAMTDGEDFELLFTVAADRARPFESSWSESFDLPCTCIGHIVEHASGFKLLDADGHHIDYDAEGFQHFR